MNASIWKKFTRNTVAAAIILPCSAIAATPATQHGAAVVLDPHRTLAANDCVSLDSQRHMTRDAVDAITPVLRNRCDYAVSVSYCIADDSATVRACESGPQRATKTLRAHETVRIESTARSLVDKDVNWIACRASAGVVSTFNHDGTRGQCVPDNLMQATAQTSTISR